MTEEAVMKTLYAIRLKRLRRFGYPAREFTPNSDLKDLEAEFLRMRQMVAERRSAEQKRLREEFERLSSQSRTRPTMIRAYISLINPSGYQAMFGRREVRDHRLPGKPVREVLPVFPGFAVPNTRLTLRTRSIPVELEKASDIR